jgi:hypothetical protein
MLIIIVTVLVAGLSYVVNAVYQNRAIVARLRQEGKVCSLAEIDQTPC